MLKQHPKMIYSVIALLLASLLTSWSQPLSPNDPVWQSQQYPPHASAPNCSGYFVAADGSDSSNGLTPMAAFKTIGYALSNSTPGSVIQLVSTDTFGPYPYGLTFQHANTLSSYGAGMATIVWTNGIGLTVSNLANISIKNVNLIGTNAINGIAFYDYVAGISNLNVVNCHITSCGTNSIPPSGNVQGGHVILVDAGTAGSDWNITIRDGMVSDSFAAGILIWSDHNNFPLCQTNVVINQRVTKSIFGKLIIGVSVGRGSTSE
jgi:hypothetical protein